MRRHYGGLYVDFRKFIPELIAFSGSKVIVAIDKDKGANSSSPETNNFKNKDLTNSSPMDLSCFRSDAPHP